MTYMDWLTGKMPQAEMSVASEQHGCQYVILDAAQAIGCLDMRETQQLFNLARNGFVICGCLQKWVNSPVPLGFALFDVSMFERFRGRREFLAARDYLGWGFLHGRVSTIFLTHLVPTSRISPPMHFRCFSIMPALPLMSTRL